jgi:hypothetical protein
MPSSPNSVLVTGDMLQITMPMMGTAIMPMAAAPVPLVGSSSKTLVGGKPACLEGDELPPPLQSSMPYMSPPFVTPGTGTFSLILLPTNKSSMLKESGKAVLLKGTVFQAKFQVASPAMMPAPPGPPVPDPVMVKMGPAQFITMNMSVEMM